MCTVTIVRDHADVLVTMNRDDRAERPEAGPELWPDPAPQFIAPRDLQAGGTWIGVNAHGVIACLLNRYDIPAAGRQSRGGLVLEAMRGASADDACRIALALDHSAYSPFTLLVIARDSSIQMDWTGHQITHKRLSVADDLMLTSSSWHAEQVRPQRETLFRQVWWQHESAEERVAAFHCQRDDATERWTPMMRRELSETKSVTQVKLTERNVCMRYWTRQSAIAHGAHHPDAELAFLCHWPDGTPPAFTSNRPREVADA